MPGVIAAGNPQTAAAGAAMLRRGGNAVDAAVAAAFASFVAELGVVHLGGSGLAQIYDPTSSQSLVYDFFSAMPGLGSAERAESQHGGLDFQQVIIDYGATTQSFYLGRGSVAVPGNVIGLCRLAADFGSLSLAEILAPAIELAREGALLDAFQADTCELLRPLYTHTKGMRAIFTPAGRMVADGERIFIPGLAKTLQTLAREGASLARTGRLAQALVTDQQARGGLVTQADLERYQVDVEPPITVRYRHYDVLLPPPASTGGVLTAFTLKVLNHFEIPPTPGGADHLSLLYEVLAATTRARPYWEKAWAGMANTEAIAYFLGEELINSFAREVGAALAGNRPSTAHAEPPGAGNTSHLGVIDDRGMAVGLTTTAGESAGYVIPGTGFIPNNILGEEDLNPHGFHQWPAGARIPTMMAPTIVRLNDSIRLVTGSGGSNRIRSAILQVLINVLDYEMALEEAVNAPRVHVQDGVLQCEAGYDPEAVGRLEEIGYSVNRWASRSIYFGGAHSVARQEDGSLIGAGDDRRGGSVALVNGAIAEDA
ncbi:MAG: gamma-glutamyltransferase [Candidatus Promineifilaceae bacterium]|nr:gamma-glutamyltransferase [Candidatus Promineifilaceae bacterium]